MPPTRIADGSAPAPSASVLASGLGVGPGGTGGPACCALATASPRLVALLWCEAYAAYACALATSVLLIAYAFHVPYARTSWVVGVIALLVLANIGLWAGRPFSRAVYSGFIGREAPRAPTPWWQPDVITRFWGDLPLMNSVGDLRSYHRLLHAARGPVCLTWVGAKPAVVFSDPRLIAQVSSKLYALFPNRPLFPFGETALLFARNTEWKAKKAKLMPLFTNHALSFMQLERTACESVDRMAAAIEWKLKHAEKDPASTTAWAEFDLYQLLVELLTHEMIEHCFDVKLAAADVWKSFPSFDGEPTLDAHIYHVHRHPYTEAIDYISLHVSAFNPGSQWLGMFGLAALPVLAVQHVRAIRKAFRSKTIIEHLTTYTEERQKGIGTSVSSTRTEHNRRGAGIQTISNAAKEDAIESPPSLSSSVTSFAAELRGLLGGEIFTTAYLQAQILEFVLGNTTALLLTAVLYHAAHDPTGRMQVRLHDEVAALLSGRADSSLIAAHFLDDHPSSLMSDLPFLNAVLLESQRLYSPGGLTRENKEHVWIKIDDIERDARPAHKNEGVAANPEGIFLPRGTEIHLSNVPHTNAAYWHEPDSYLPERWLDIADDSPHVLIARSRPSAGVFFPFGLGARKCLGANYAQAQLRLSLVLLVARFEFRPLPGATPVRDPAGIFELKQGLVLLPKHPMPVELRKRA